MELSHCFCSICQKNIQPDLEDKEICPICGYHFDYSKKYCNYCQKYHIVMKDMNKCPECLNSFGSSPGNILDIETHDSVLLHLSQFEKICWERFIGTYRRAIVNYVYMFAQRKGCVRDYLWAEEIVSRLLTSIMEGKIQRDTFGNIKFRHILMRKVQDIVLKTLMMEKRCVTQEEEFMVQTGMDKELETFLGQDILEEIYKRVLYSEKFNDYDRAIIQYTMQRKQLPDADHLEKIWGIRSENARQILSRFKKRCKKYLGYLALGEQARKEEELFFKQQNVKNF